MADTHYPRLLYRPGTQEAPWGIPSDLLTVETAEEEADALANGWFTAPTTADDAKAKPAKAKPADKAAG